jgi:hypothetical protein
MKPKQTIEKWRKDMKDYVDKGGNINPLNNYQSDQRSTIPSEDDDAIKLVGIIFPELKGWIKKHLRNNSAGRDKAKWRQIFAGNVFEIITALKVENKSVDESKCWRNEVESAIGQSFWCLVALCDVFNFDLGDCIINGARDFRLFREERYGTNNIEKLRQAILDDMRTTKTKGSYRSKITK